MSTVASVNATASTCSMTCRSAGLVPTMPQDATAVSVDRSSLLSRIEE
jgi:hypothetical protein